MEKNPRERISIVLALVGLLVGGLALVVATVALSKANSLGKRVPTDLADQLVRLKVDLANSAAAADKASEDIVSLTRSTQSAFDSIGPDISKLNLRVQLL